MEKRFVPERLNMALEVCFQRDGVCHQWEREYVDSYILRKYGFGKLFCLTDLTEKEWVKYLELAACELARANSALPEVPRVPAWLGDPEQNTEKQARLLDKIMQILCCDAYIVENDQPPKLNF